MLSCHQSCIGKGLSIHILRQMLVVVIADKGGNLYICYGNIVPIYTFSSFYAILVDTPMANLLFTFSISPAAQCSVRILSLKCYWLSMQLKETHATEPCMTEVQMMINMFVMIIMMVVLVIDRDYCHTT